MAPSGRPGHGRTLGPRGAVRPTQHAGGSPLQEIAGVEALPGAPAAPVRSQLGGKDNSASGRGGTPLQKWGGPVFAATRPRFRLQNKRRGGGGGAVLQASREGQRGPAGIWGGASSRVWRTDERKKPFRGAWGGPEPQGKQRRAERKKTQSTARGWREKSRAALGAPTTWIGETGRLGIDETCEDSETRVTGHRDLERRHKRETPD